ncbi:MAG: cytochrome b/b6 domain-containing protein [Dissulfurispiraceae bacterium]|nr:cytochrome b/b6 domain-containing protein [Dissulfurispiraceae bacterium]
MSKMIRKASTFEIINHWVLAVSCIFLAVSGFAFLFHLEQLNTVFGSFATLKVLHNWIGVVFVVSLLSTVSHYLPVALNLSSDDLVWLSKGGGYIIKNVKLPEQDIINSGQKLYYLAILGAGVLISISGFIIWLLPGFKTLILISHLLHNVSFIVFVMAIPIHAYLASIANPGTFRIMVQGTVPLEWARKRHGKWIKRLGY